MSKKQKCLFRRGTSVVAGLVCACAAAIFPTSTLEAQARWQEIGPEGGFVVSFGQDPNRPARLYTGTIARGIFFSDDDGDSWSNTDLRSGPPVRILTAGTGAAQASTGDGVYAGIGVDVFHSANGRTGWSSTGLMASSTVTAIGLDARFAYAGTSTGLYRLDSTGWNRIGEDPPIGDGHIRAFHHAADGTLYVGTNQGLFKTNDGGESFSPIAPDLFEDVYAIAADPGSNELFVFNLTPRGLYRSQGGGSGSWTLLTDNLPLTNRLQSVSVQPHPSGRALYAVTNGSLLQSTDLGASWQLLDVDYSDRFAAIGIFADRTTPGVLYAPGGLGLARSFDSGETWSLANRGRRALTLDDYVLADSTPPTIYASSTQGYVYGTRDGGPSWDLLAQPEIEPSARLAVDPRSPDTLYRGVSAAVLRSDDGGETWTTPDMSLFCNIVSTLAIAPSNPDILYAQGYPLATACVLGQPQACYTHRSLDGGQSWSCIAEIGPTATRLTVDPRDSDRVYALSRSALFRSDDGGGSWGSLTQSLEIPFLDFVLDPSNPDILYLTNEDGLFRSSDRGATWVRWELEPSPGPFTALAVHPQKTDNLYALAGDRTLWSTDSGRTWRALAGEPADLGLRGPLRIESRQPGQPDRLYAGTAGAGVVRRTAPVETECTPGAQTLCLGGPSGDRFEISVDWRDFQGRTGQGQGLYLPNGPGAFWFFHPDNIELAVKVLDGRPVNGHWWVFFGSLTNVEFTLTVTDTTTGLVQQYFNPLRNFASRGDTRAFDDSSLFLAGSSDFTAEATGATSPVESMMLIPAGAALAETAAEGGCAGDTTSLCLSDRFRLRVTWQDFQDRTGTGQAIPLTDDTGSFWFFAPSNTELLVKVLDGRPVNGHWWVFFGSLTNVQFTLTVEDLATGEQRDYVNPSRNFASRGDTRAFDS
ncbi:MAG: hypothetical protein SX243_10080 [Acidobacteriota bacterium]|nr:hypothetical protein [Acidobacteriota bacterium]